MKREKRDEQQIQVMLNEIAVLESFIRDLDFDGFLDSDITQRAVAMTMINIGELSKKFSEPMLENMTSVPWDEIRGLRNFVAHQYGDVDMERMWNTLMYDIPELKSALLIQQSQIQGLTDAHT